MMGRVLGCLSLAVVLLLASSGDAAAQRKGFIIGGGLGPGLTFGDYDTKFGGTTDFKIGAMVGQSLQVYYRNTVNFTDSSAGYDLEGAGVGGLGVTYQFACKYRVNGVVGFSSRIGISGGDWSTDNGFGLGAGVGYEFADLWIVSLDGSWGRPGGDYNMFNLALTINILSH
jgi:hypothetical protein